MAFIELHDGIIINLSNLNSITPISSTPSGSIEKRWNANVGNSSVQISDSEYSTIKTILGNQLY